MHCFSLNFHEFPTILYSVLLFLWKLMVCGEVRVQLVRQWVGLKVQTVLGVGLKE